MNGSNRFPTGDGALVRFDFQKNGCPGWIRAINLPGQSRALSLIELQGKNGSANRSRSDLSPIPAACVATNALAEWEMVERVMIIKTILRPVPPRHGPRYERGALLISATEEWGNGASCRFRPGAVFLEGTRAAFTPMTLGENGGCVRYRAGLSSSSARR